jgi:hypothetical protein
MQALRKGSTGEEVVKWQLFLRGQDFLEGAADGNFGEATHSATIRFQKDNHLVRDGVVGQLTLTKAMARGFSVVDNPREGRCSPPVPTGVVRITESDAVMRRFGKMAYKPAPVSDNPEAIVITNDWVKDNIVEAHIPQLSKIVGKVVGGKTYGAGPRSGVVQCHKLFVEPLQRTFEDWDDLGLLHLLITFDGLWVPRFVRGCPGVLSNHAVGTAIDLNAYWNGLHCLPALVGQLGSVRELVPAANKNGLWWLGHSSVSDGMHFELGVLV